MTHRRWTLAALLVAGATGRLLAQSPALRVDLPTDTTLPSNARWPVRVETTAPAQVTVMLAPLLPETAPLHIETQLVSGGQMFWPLRGPDGGAVLPGAYRLVVTVEQDGVAVRRVVRVVLVERIMPDTQPHPPVLDQMAFLPESSRSVSRRPGFLIIAGIGVATFATTQLLRDDPTTSPVTIAVPSALTLGGLVGFLKGRTTVHSVPANVAHNHRLIADDAAARQRIAAANATAVATASLRVRLLDQP